LTPGDTLLGDALYSSFPVLATAEQRGGHVVAERPRRSHKRLRPRLMDQTIFIEKPRKKSDSITDDEYEDLPDELCVRVIKVSYAPKGFRPKTKYILTTHIDSSVVSAEEIAALYQDRWQAELHLRSLKTVLGMDILVSRSPPMVVKEIWMYMLAYNLIRTKMLEAAVSKACSPLVLSFRAAQQVLNVARQGACGLSYEDILHMISTQRVAKRPGRYEPRALKRRKKNFTLLRQSRRAAKTKLYKKYKVSPRR
jgi:hypothetical protein